ncbi:hypothetical protein RND81_03G016000 [Saponaria officinalis]|uniref:DUF3615 domain-containing protein n=1 Tax=Saponaria officinalis TaxID=3572 RepID=A0AAW1M0R7_SAPOF
MINDGNSCLEAQGPVVWIDPNKLIRGPVGVDLSVFPCNREGDQARLDRKKRFIRKKHVNDAVKNEAENWKELDCRTAEEAVKFYNAKHGTQYEVVEPLGSYCRLYCGFWFHCNFRAQCKSGSGHGLGSAPKLFFAELYCKGANKLIVNVCTMLEGLGPSPSTVQGCNICGDMLLHPVNGFEVGN